MQVEFLREPVDLMFGRSSQTQHFREGRQFVIVQLQHVGQPERLLNHLARIELLAKIDVKYAQRILGAAATSC